MRRALLIYNRASGRNRARRVSLVENVLSILQTAGVEASAVESQGPGRAGEQARGAIATGFDTLIACGGDGTIHDVLQGMANTEAALGVIPLGTGNILARNLGLPIDPLQAASSLISAEPRRIALGKIEYQSKESAASSYFVVAAGVGMDALLMYQLAAGSKQLGMLAYYATGIRLGLLHSLPWFELEFTDRSSGNLRRESVAQVLASRVSNYGEVMRRVTPDAGLHREDFQLLIFKSRSRLRLWRYLFSTYTRRAWNFPEVELAHATEAFCKPVATPAAHKIYAEADGEALGGLPVRISMAPSALTVLFPRDAEKSAAMRES